MLIRNLVLLTLAATVRVNAQSLTPARLSAPIEFWNPAWSPDGEAIVFESTLGGKHAIYIIGADGSALRRLTTDTSNSVQPGWSPNGRQIVFSSDRHGASDIHVMAADGSSQARLTNMGSGGWYQSSFSPDGAWIVFQGRHDTREVRERVYVMRADGSALRLLSDSTFGAERPRWSKDSRSVEFTRVPYPVRLWSEMRPALMRAARDGSQRVAVPLEGGPAMVIESRAQEASADSAIPQDAASSPDRRKLTYSKRVDGWPGLYVYDVATKSERLLIGGPGAGPLGYLRTATLTAVLDTLDTYEGPRNGGPPKRGSGAYIIRSLQPIGGGRWELVDSWFDSTGKQNARQASRTAPRSLVTALEYTRATSDSASMSYTLQRTTGWVVPAGKPAQLIDGTSTGDRYAGTIALSAVAKTKPANGTVFMSVSGSLYGGDPLATRLDSIRVVRRDTLYRGAVTIPTVVLTRGTVEVWLDENSGAEVASKGRAGPEKFWWHVRRGVAVPGSR